MEALTPEAYFIQQGLLGVIIVVLGGVIIWQQRKLDKKDEEIKALYKSVEIVQEKRLEDSKENIANITTLGASLVSANQAIQKSVDSIVQKLRV